MHCRWAGALFIFGLMLGYGIVVRSWGGSLYVYLGEERSPATVRLLSDYAALDRRSLANDVHQQLVGGAELIRQNGELGVRLGHPLLKLKGGGYDFACAVQGRPGVFDRIELIFWGIGITESGHPPRMVVESSCQTGEDLNRLATLWLPMSQIFANPAKDQQLEFYEDPPLTIRLEQIPGEWPENWVLTHIRLFREDNPSNSLEIGASLIKEARSQILSFEWDPKSIR
jgi:hypothetical protein